MALPVYAFAVPAPETGPLGAARRAAVGRRMRSLRNQAGLTQAAVAEESGLTRQFYLAVEAGQRTLSLDNLFAIADALRTDPRDLLSDLPDAATGLQPTQSAK
jgi:transcriptional regulator with XRE-family HTH domain